LVSAPVLQSSEWNWTAEDHSRGDAGDLCCGISGAFDLRPLLRTSINRDLLMSADEAVEASPLLRLGRLPAAARLVPLLGLVGGDETAGFKQWTADLVAGWQARGGAASYGEVAGCNHFTILNRLAEADGDMARAMAAFLG